jgi:Mlc titration factor MtfA (ptsG expression regulator)
MLEWLFGTRKGLLKKDVTDDERRRLDQSLWQAKFLSPKERDQLIRWSRVFIAEKNWEGCNGLTLSESMKWCVASVAGLMVLAYPDWYFDRTASIVIHPRPYKARIEPPIASSTFNPTLGGEFHRAGETIYRGPVVLNWQDIEAASQNFNHGHHLVIHEFAHQLDMINGPNADGLPPLPGDVDEDAWRKAMRAEYQMARDMVSKGYRILINDYGLTQESEFFAVASELYFQTPHELAEYHPNVYALLNQFYVSDMSKKIDA